MTHKLFLIVCTITLLIACNHSPENEQHEESETATLHLNNGEQWIANEETHIGMTNIQELLNTMDGDVNYDSLVSQLKGQTRFIINKCNMTGEDHDQLHLVLLPILKSLDDIAAAEDKAAKKANVTSIEKNLADYFKHFKTI